MRKIKEVETGGGYTPYDEPYILDMQRGMCGYADVNGFNPIQDYWMKKNRVVMNELIDKPQQPMPVNENFDSEVTKQELDYLYDEKEPPF